MKRNPLTPGVLLIFVVSACAPQAAPTANPLDVQHTAEAAAFTMVALTQESLPTATLLPPTATTTNTPHPTLTAPPSPTIDPALAPTSTAQPTSGSGTSNSTADACNKPLTSWTGPTATFTIKNETKPQGKIVLSLYVVSPRGDCGYLTDLSSGPVGTYSAGAFVNGKKNFKVFGGFTVEEGEWKIVIRNDKITAWGSCYPNC